MNGKVEDVMSQPLLDILSQRLKKTQLGNTDNLQRLKSVLETAHAEANRLLEEREAARKQATEGAEASNAERGPRKRLSLPKLHVKK